MNGRKCRILLSIIPIKRNIYFIYTRLIGADMKSAFDSSENQLRNAEFAMFRNISSNLKEDDGSDCIRDWNA
jgi:hypothetical protein